MIVRLIIAVGAAAMSTVCVAQDSGWQKMTETRNDATFCVVSQAVRLDDKSTSPDVIATAAFRACKSQVDAFSSAVRAKAVEMVPTDPMGTWEADFQRQLQPMLQDMKDLAIQAVLEHRVAK